MFSDSESSTTMSVEVETNKKEQPRQTKKRKLESKEHGSQSGSNEIALETALQIIQAHVGTEKSLRTTLARLTSKIKLLEAKNEELKEQYDELESTLEKYRGLRRNMAKQLDKAATSIEDNGYDSDADSNSDSDSDSGSDSNAE